MYVYMYILPAGGASAKVVYIPREVCRSLMGPPTTAGPRGDRVPRVPQGQVQGDPLASSSHLSFASRNFRGTPTCVPLYLSINLIYTASLLSPYKVQVDLLLIVSRMTSYVCMPSGQPRKLLPLFLMVFSKQKHYMAVWDQSSGFAIPITSRI